MKLISISVINLIITISSCNGQSPVKTTEIYNEKFKWTITIPESFQNVSPNEWRQIQNNGQEEIEKTYDSKVENTSKTICAFRSGELDFFESNYQPIDSTDKSQYLKYFQKVNQLLYGTFEAQIPNAKLDSVSSIEMIDGLTFHTFKVAITYPNKMVMDFWMFSRVFGENEFTVNLMTIDKTKQGMVLNSWRKSRFGIK